MTDTTVKQRYHILLMYEQGIMTASLAAHTLHMSERQFFRILKRFQTGDRTMESLQYHSHQAWNRTDKKREDTIVQLNRDYPDALNTHLSWLVWDAYGVTIKPPTIRSILINHDRYVPFKEKRERAYKKFQATHFGALVQLDTADGYWLKGYPLLHLILAIDDATRTIVGGGFYYHDSTLNNMIVIKEIIRKYGVPPLFYTDNDSKFRVIRHGKSRYQSYTPEVLAGEAETEIRRALMEIGSGLITHAPFHPQGKGKIEKLLRFVQECFVQHHHAANLAQLN